MNFKKGDKVCIDSDSYIGGTVPLLFLRSDGKMAECIIDSMSASAEIMVFVNMKMLEV